MRSGLLFPVVPGIVCSLSFVPKLRGTARTILSRIAFCLSHTSPRLLWQWCSTCARVSGILPHKRHWVEGTCWQYRAWTVLTGSRLSLALCISLYWGKVKNAPVYVKNVESRCRATESNALPWSVDLLIPVRWRGWICCNTGEDSTLVTGSGGGYRGGGQTQPMPPPPPLTDKDTPPVHCNEFNYMSSAPHCFSSCRR